MIEEVTFSHILYYKFSVLDIFICHNSRATFFSLQASNIIKWIGILMCMYMLQQKNFKWSNVQEMRMLKQNIKSIERGMNSQKEN